MIDYKAFNYIEKVIDNPEKWGKFVHKKNENKDFITVVPEKEPQKLWSLSEINNDFPMDCLI